MRELPKTFCPYPWIQISTSPIGELGICCETVLPQDHNGTQNFLNSELLVSLRKDLASGIQSPVCANCWKKEAAGGRSTRIDVFSRFLDENGLEKTLGFIEDSRQKDFHVDGPQQLDVKPGNICNLKCRMCSPHNSSKIAAEAVQNAETLQSFASELMPPSGDHSGVKHPPLADLMAISDSIIRLNISGGEPTLMKQVKAYLSSLVEAGYSKNILLTFNTNATNTDWDLFDLFSEFKKVELYISVDGVGSVYEYIRCPAKWDEVAANIISLRDRLKHPVEIFIAPVYQALNVLNLYEILKWSEDADIPWILGNSVIHPAHQDPLVLPLFIREIGAQRLADWYKTSKGADPERIQSAVQHLRSPQGSSSYEFSRFLQYNALLDKVRNQSLEQSCPELYALLQLHLGSTSFQTAASV